MKTKMRSSLLIFTLLALAGPLLFDSGCGGCQGAKGPLGLVPADSLVVLEIPSLRKAFAANLSLFDRVAQGPLAKTLVSSRKAQLKQEFGIDLDDAKSFQQKGIDPRAGIAISINDDGLASLVMPTTDAKALDKYLRELFTRLSSGALSFSDEKKDGVKVTLAKPNAGQGAAGWTFHDKHVIFVMAFERKAHAGLAARIVAATKVEKSIETNATFMRARKTLARFHAFVYLDGKGARRRVAERAKEQARFASDNRKQNIDDERELTEGLLAYFDGFSLAWQAEHARLEVKALVSVPEGKRGALREVLSGEGSAAPLARYIGDDALLVARSSLHPTRFFDRTLQLVPPRQKRSLYRAIERWEQRNNLSLKKDVLGVFAGRYAAALFAPASGADSDPRQLLRSAAFVGVAQVKDHARAAALLDRVERFMVVNRQEVRTRSQGKRKTFHLSVAGQELLAWTLVDRILLVSTPARLEPSVALVKKGGRNIRDRVASPRAKRLLDSDEGQVLYQDLAAIKSALQKIDLPMPLRLVAMPALDSLGKLQDVTLGAEVASEGVRADLILRLK